MRLGIHTMTLREVIFLSVIISTIHAEYVSYKNYKVYKLVPESENEVKILVDLKEQNKHMFWNDVVSVNSDNRIMVAPENQFEFETYLKSVNITATIAIQDVEELINNELRRSVSRNAEYDWKEYLSLDEIYAWLDKIAEDYSEVVTLVQIGTSSEGRPIKGIVIDFKKERNPVIGMIEGGIHAREWISPATVTYIINEFLTSTDPNVKTMAENIVWHIFPVVNPDGYVYTFTDNRLWRKNRNKAYNTTCDQLNVSDDRSNGVDLNRNFGFVWNSAGTSNSPCGDTYAGPYEFSEPETRAIRQYVIRIQATGRMVYYFAFHSYSQLVLVPYSHVGGWEVLTVPNYADMFEIAVRGMDKLQTVNGTQYMVGTSKDVLYAVSGSSFDWVRGVADVPIVYLFELRDEGQYGFLLPAEQIIPNCQEVMAGLVEMEKVTRGMGYYENSVGKVFYSFVMLIISLVINVSM